MKKNITYVTYSEENFFPDDVFNESCCPEPSFNEWSIFFSDRMIPQDKNNPEHQKIRILARNSCPLRRIAPDRYAFLHTSFLQYFARLAAMNAHKPSQNPPIAPLNSQPTTASMPFFQTTATVVKSQTASASSFSTQAKSDDSEQHGSNSFR